MQNRKDMKEFIEQMLINRLSPFYYYHDISHTLYVYDKVIEIGHHENCTSEEIVLLKTAALWHDSGYINKYHNHEEEGCKLAREFLPKFGYNETDISIVCNIIMATKIPQSPKTKLEEIIADADLEYLATNKAEFLADKLYKELHHIHPSLTLKQWNDIQISFIQKHHFFTNYCIKNKTANKLEYLHKLINERE